MYKENSAFRAVNGQKIAFLQFRLLGSNSMTRPITKSLLANVAIRKMRRVTPIVKGSRGGLGDVYSVRYCSPEPFQARGIGCS